MKRTLAHLLIGCLALSLSVSAWADITGKVVGVTDGDTITVLRDRQQVKVRLVDIDAPEKAQPFGNRSKRALDALVHSKEVLVVERGKDRYQRILAVLWDEQVNVNLLLVAMGYAEVYRGTRCQAYCEDLYRAEVKPKRDRMGM